METVSTTTNQGPKTPAAPLQGALNVQGEELEKLVGLVRALEERLAPVTSNTPGADGQKDESVPGNVSALTLQVYVQVNITRLLQARLHNLLDQLEV